MLIPPSIGNPDKWVYKSLLNRGDDHSLPYSTNQWELIDSSTLTLILLFEHQAAPSRAIFVAGVQRTTAATSHCPARTARSHQRFRPRWKKGRWWHGCLVMEVYNYPKMYWYWVYWGFKKMLGSFSVVQDFVHQLKKNIHLLVTGTQFTAWKSPTIQH